MKPVLLPVALTFFDSVYVRADLSSIQNQIAKIIEARNTTTPVGPTLRQFGTNQFNEEYPYGNMAFIDNFILPWATGSGYGCWCYFGSEWSHAGGPVQDEFDAVCKQLINGYRCARIDAMLRDENCDAGVVTYTEVIYSPDYEVVRESCTINNLDDQCAIDACILEMSFVSQFVNAVVLAYANDYEPQDSLKVDNGWNREDSCPTVSISGAMHSCCGAGLMRQSFNVETQECCVNSNDSTEYVALLGSCPPQD